MSTQTSEKEREQRALLKAATERPVSQAILAACWGTLGDKCSAMKAGAPGGGEATGVSAELHAREAAPARPAAAERCPADTGREPRVPATAESNSASSYVFKQSQEAGEINIQNIFHQYIFYFKPM